MVLTEQKAIKVTQALKVQSDKLVRKVQLEQQDKTVQLVHKVHQALRETQEATATMAKMPW